MFIYLYMELKDLLQDCKTHLLNNGATSVFYVKYATRVVFYLTVELKSRIIEKNISVPLTTLDRCLIERTLPNEVL